MFDLIFGIKIIRSIQYFGHRIKLRKIFFHERSLLLDREKIPMEEAQPLEKIMAIIPFGPHFKSKDEILSAMIELRFPTYGSFYANQMHGAPDQRLELMSIEIPRVGKERYFVLEKKSDDEFVVISDFVASLPGVINVLGRGDELQFVSHKGNIVRTMKRNVSDC